MLFLHLCPWPPGYFSTLRVVLQYERLSGWINILDPSGKGVKIPHYHIAGLGFETLKFSMEHQVAYPSYVPYFSAI